ELAELVRLAARSRAEASAVARREGHLSLRREAAAARAALTDAGARVRLELPPGPLDDEAGDVLAAVLREAANNVLRHAVPRHCEITVTVEGDTARLCVRNDGADAADARPTRTGGGLANLAARAHAVGGTLTAEATGAGWFVLLAEIPLRTPGKTGMFASHATDSPEARRP
ncbi:MAG TPA: hypothetical protein VHJ17_18345, partial [Thermomonospora sp.]|nr:hypothetical protein [Thermomonospora sp.]